MPPELVGWTGTACLFVGSWHLGNHRRSGFLFHALGDVIWLGYSVYLALWSSAVPCAVFTVLALWNWWKWR